MFLDNEDLSSATASSFTETMENDKWKEMENKDNSFLPVERPEAYELEYNETAVLDFAEELTNNIRKRDWESALSNLGELEEMLRVLLENDQ